MILCNIIKPDDVIQNGRRDVTKSRGASSVKRYWGVTSAATWALVKVPDSKIRGDNMGPIWGRQDPGGPHVGPMNFAIWVGWLSS